MIEGLNPAGPEWMAIKRHLLMERVAVINDLLVPGQGIAAYDVLRGRVIQIDRIIKAVETAPAASPPGKPGKDTSGY